ncbi:MAG: hypothetical protein OXH83_22110 [Bryobacterales bacterium]|nr:hypothetical protein [Bryobacterales bacterium]
MPAQTNYRSRSHSDAEILSAFNSIAAELGQDPEQSRLTVVIMKGYSSDENIPLSEIHSQPFVQHAEEHKTASWEGAWIYFRPLHMEVRLERDRDHGDDKISISFSNNPSGSIDASQTLAAVYSQFVPLNRMTEIKRVLGPEMAEFYRLREDGLSRLESLTQKLVTETHDYRMQLDAEMAGHKRALTESFEEKTQGSSPLPNFRC